MADIRAMVPQVWYVDSLLPDAIYQAPFISGDIVHVTVLGQHIVMLNSAKAVTDLLERRSAVYSSRPQTTMIGDL